jgi:membrane protease subunit HflC
MKRPWRTLAFLLLVALSAAVLSRCWFVVDETRFVLLSEFGRVVDVLGDDPGEVGPHWKRPWLSVLTVDRRLQVTEPPSREVLTGDKRNLEVAPYVVWKVVDPSRFYQSAGGIETASSRLEERVAASVSDALSRSTLESLASADPDVWKLDTITRSIRDQLSPDVRADLGIELLDVRLKRFNHPLEVRPAVFDLIRSERKQVASRLRAEGEAEYQTLASRADRERDERLSRAEAEAERLKAEGEAEAARLLNEAHAQDPKFYELIRTLDTYRSILDGKATVVLSSSSPLLRLLRDGPAGELPASLSPKSPGSSAASETISAPETAP